MIIHQGFRRPPLAPAATFCNTFMLHQATTWISNRLKLYIKTGGYLKQVKVMLKAATWVFSITLISLKQPTMDRDDFVNQHSLTEYPLFNVLGGTAVMYCMFLECKVGVAMLQTNARADRKGPEGEQQAAYWGWRASQWGREVQGPAEPQLPPAGPPQPTQFQARGARVSTLVLAHTHGMHTSRMLPSTTVRAEWLARLSLKP